MVATTPGYVVVGGIPGLHRSKLSSLPTQLLFQSFDLGTGPYFQSFRLPWCLRAFGQVLGTFLGLSLPVREMREYSPGHTESLTPQVSAWTSYGAVEERGYPHSISGSMN